MPGLAVDRFPAGSAHFEPEESAPRRETQGALVTPWNGRLWKLRIIKAPSRRSVFQAGQNYPAQPGQRTRLMEVARPPALRFLVRDRDDAPSPAYPICTCEQRGRIPLRVQLLSRTAELTQVFRTHAVHRRRIDDVAIEERAHCTAEPFPGLIRQGQRRPDFGDRFADGCKIHRFGVKESLDDFLMA